ncbi:PilT/PilU family type 4a pilus ATPase [Pseudenhygromyxa sp. WMMC2535]|uniref:type IV pilus twitching motility protein PilT n=1 Tax=Pseudenhygromyxa sp. WMMC2535 TaxID=2712867 RepID=UPI0015517D94|nr:PilT/PilU family type 4a pilus ATPase [Pseudenhygromyxa sp. WMMC2535]NVB41170.1 PilT/PilU family type 4a pilus ATPase [Pseudenhygromyxa sp. WMMC2535]
MPALDRYFELMLSEKASDLHLSVGYPPMLRLKGDLVPHGQQPIDEARMRSLLDELLDEPTRARFHEERDLDFAYSLPDGKGGAKARFRCNYLYKHTGPGAVFRTIPSKILTAEELGLPPHVLDLAKRRAGLVLVTGPTGSGKSTTLAAMISWINHNRAGHILTIEDPVEFVHQPVKCLITHREVGHDVPSFADAIRSAGRENADVILVGELRGPETMRLALQLASYGVLIFATVHTNSAAATIDRFINVFPAGQQPAIRGMLGESLAGIIAQQLLKRADGSGRVAAHEVLIGTNAVSTCIRENRTSMIDSLIQAGSRDGMQGMDATLDKLVRAGTISAQDALDKALDKNSFAKQPHIASQIDMPVE